MPDCSLPAWWLPYVQPFATVLLGLGAAALAYRQWLTANEKLRLDLCDRRIGALEDLGKTLFSEVLKGLSQEGANTCHNKIIRARLLFGKDVEWVLMQIDYEIHLISTGDAGSITHLRSLQQQLFVVSKPYLQFNSRVPRYL